MGYCWCGFANHLVSLPVFSALCLRVTSFSDIFFELARFGVFCLIKRFLFHYFPSIPFPLLLVVQGMLRSTILTAHYFIDRSYFLLPCTCVCVHFLRKFQMRTYSTVYLIYCVTFVCFQVYTVFLQLCVVRHSYYSPSYALFSFPSYTLCNIP